MPLIISHLELSTETTLTSTLPLSVIRNICLTIVEFSPNSRNLLTLQEQQ
jgi:hypothetical protein